MNLPPASLTTDSITSHVCYIQHDAPLASAASAAFPLLLPKSALQAQQRFGVAGRRVLVTIHIEELP